MPIKFRFTFATERGSQIAEGLRAKQDDLDNQCSDPQQSCTVQLKELPEGRIQVTVTHPRAVAHQGDWFELGPDAGQFRKTFENPTVDEVCASLSQFLQGPEVERRVVATAERFLAKLGTVREQFRWQLIPDRGRHAERRSQARLRVRGVAKTGLDQHIELDPIAALCYALTGMLYEHEDWEDAAKALRMPSDLASDLLAAANDRTWRGMEGQRRPNNDLESLRGRLIERVGLSAPPL